MGALFGKSKKVQSRVTEHDKAVLQLKQQRDKLKQYQKRIELSLEKDRELARKCLKSGRKERAKLLLRKKKYQEKLLENTDVQLENLEKLASDIEFAQVEQQVLNGLKVGNQALKDIHKIITVEEIENILDETREGVEKQREIDDILCGVLSQDDENDVLIELDELIANENVTETTEITKIDEDISDKLPEVPTDLPEDEKRKHRIEEKQSEEKVLVEG